MFCTKCGLKNPVDAIFCYKCGNKLFVGENNNTIPDLIESGDNFLIDFWTNIINFDGKMNKHSFWAAVLTMSIVNIIIVAFMIQMVCCYGICMTYFLLLQLYPHL